MISDLEIQALVRRTTSYAKEALEARLDAALDRYGETSRDFNLAREDDPSQSVEIPLSKSEGIDRSEMVANDQPKLQPRPSPEIAREPERQSFDERWTEEQQRSADRQQEDYER